MQKASPIGPAAVDPLPAELRLSLPGGVPLELVRIRAGQFTMGAPEGQGKDDERPTHAVRITRDWYVGKYPVTQEQYHAVTGQNPAKFALSPQHPVDNVSWEDAQQFCQRLRAVLQQRPEALGAESLTVANVGLPTEAQWEYVCRAGTESAWSFGEQREQMPEYGWCEKNAGKMTHAVGQLKPNPWGLYDLHGNIREWCADWYAPRYAAEDAVDRDRRPPRWERAWNDVEENDFGLDEFIAFCREINTEPLIVVNTGLGGVTDAADEVEYANGSAATRWGAERAKNGHAEPYRVVWWGVGNEMFGDWQLGNVPVARYAVRHNAFAAAMQAADPQLKLIGVGAAGKWNDLVVPGCAGHMDLLSMHHYSERKLGVPFSPADAAKYESEFLTCSDCIAQGVRNMVADLRQRQGKGDAAVDRLRLCIDEWGLVRDWNAAPDGPGVGSFEHYYTIGDAVTVGRALHELLRASDLVGMANWPQTVNVIGAIKTTRNHAAMDPVGHLLTLYRSAVNGHVVPAVVAGPSPVDAVAALDRTACVLSVGLINFSPREAVAVKLKIAGVVGLQPATAWRIHGPDLGSINIPGQPESVTLTPLPGQSPPEQPVSLPPHSITVLSIPCGR